MLKVGDLLVRFGKILKISAIKTDSVELHPFFNLKTSSGLTYSIPSESLNHGQIRPIVTLEKLNQLLKTLFIKSSPVSVDVIDTKNALNTHELSETLLLVKSLWLEKQNHTGFLPSGRLSLYQQALTQSTEEIAAIKSILPDEAKLLVLSLLKQAN